MGSVTAIVSAYYCAQWLQGRIFNLLEQEPRPEIVVVTQRDSEEHNILLRFVDFIKLILTEDVPTIYAAWNMAIAEATGDYLTNANSDDRLYTGALERLAWALDENSQAVAVYMDCDKVNPDGLAIGRYRWAEGGLAVLQRGCFLGPMPMWRRELHDRYGEYDGQMESAGDYEWWLRLAYSGEMFVKAPGLCGAYMLRGDSAEHRDPTISTWEANKAKSRWSLRRWWAQFENVYHGQKCYILGNGPSLNDIDLGSLDAPTFGSNRIYLSGFTPEYHVTVNPLVLEQFGDEIRGLDCIKFRAGYELDTSQPVAGFYKPFEQMWEGHTVTYVALQIAYYMGFSKVVLLGVDHNYGKVTAPPNTEQLFTGDDGGHFSPEYFKGHRWHTPDLAASEMAYRIARQVYEADGRRVVNSSTRTKLNVFEVEPWQGMTIAA